MQEREKQRWQALLKEWEKLVEGAKERKDLFTTSSGIPLKAVYTPLDLEGFHPEEELGLPGVYPFTRGIHPTMYRGKLWTMRQYSGFGTAEETNRRFKFLLSQGNMGLSVAFDLPTQMGLDSDDPRASGEVGRTGVAIDTIEDMRILFDGIPLDEVTTSMTINATASILLALYIAVADERGIPRNRLGGTIQNDILKEYIARGTYIYPPQPSMRIITDIFAFTSNELPRWNSISISGYHIREAGATAVQELAFTLADGIAYVQAAVDAGLDVDQFAGRLSFFFNAHNNFFEEIAKFRAARRMWAKIMKERFSAKDPRSMMLRFHTQTGGSTLTSRQPYNNIIRVTIQALAAVLGGTQSLHTNGFDEALALPTEESARLALRTQQIIAYESGVTKVVDPLGGSYFVEKLTLELEKKAWEYIRKIDELGGMVKAIEVGYPQREIHESAYQYQKAVEEGREIVVGVNRFTVEEEREPEILRVAPELERKQMERLRAFKARRDTTRVEQALSRLKEAAQGEENLMPFIIEAVKANCTLGEIAGTLKEVFGTYEEVLLL
jgi:methylmalonyl-CoA mutase N-terminal domain/subunit